MSHPPPTLKIYHFAGQKKQHNVCLHGHLQELGPFDQQLLVKATKKVTYKVFAEKTSDTPPK